MSLAPVGERASLVEQVHDRLVEAVCRGDLAPGAPLVQERLAEELGVSRQPVIQALAMLRRDGLAEVSGRRGYRVAPLTPRLVADVYELRGAIDRMAAAGAARRADPTAGDRLARVLADGDAAVAAGAASDALTADVAFHRTIYELSGNGLVQETAAPLWRHIRRVMAAVLQDGGQRETAWREHRAIADAVLAGDAAAADAAAGAHAARAAAELVQRLTQDQAA